MKLQSGITVVCFTHSVVLIGYIKTTAHPKFPTRNIEILQNDNMMFKY